MSTIDLTPSPDQYEAVARRFMASCADDTNEPRRASALRVLGELVGLAAYLATLPDGAQRIERLKLYAGTLSAGAASRLQAHRRQAFTCPEWAPLDPKWGGDDAVRGCGATFHGIPDREGLVDCPECGIWFRASEKGVRDVR